MATRAYTNRQPWFLFDGREGGTFISSNEDSNWGRSTKDAKGNLVLKPQSCGLKRYNCYSYRMLTKGTAQWTPVDAYLPRPASTVPPSLNAAFASLENQAYARFNGKLRKGSASLGVTLASWKQSRDMIVNRHNHAKRTLDSAYTGLLGNKRAVERLRREREPLANQVLETEFGWKPLFEDVHAAIFTACDALMGSEWMTSRARTSISESRIDSGNPQFIGTMTWRGKAWVSYGARVSISNPNAWMLNRLGLINPATVIWDLVPWSFVVNMFVNVNQILNSFTDEVGLSITDRHLTRGQAYNLIHDIKISPGQPGGSMRSGLAYKERTRVLDTAPALSWQLKVPKLDWELALIASSLVVQKIGKINRLIRAI